ncbi:WcaI family glycosyltransferase [Pedobacter sp. PWIIR3]
MEVKNRIMVIGINCLPELTGIGKYTGEMVTWLAENEHQTTMVTSFPYYPNWKVQKPYYNRFYKKETLEKGRLEIYRCPMYIPSVPSGLKRLIHEATFFLSSFLIILRLLFKPKYDLILSIAPPFHLGFLALFYRFFKGGKIVYHIQDLQVDAAKELKMLPDGIFSILFVMERFIMKHVNYVSTISEGMLAKVRRKIEKEPLFFPNWVDTEGFYPLIAREKLKINWGYQLNDTVILYSGSIGEKQGLDSLIRIAANLRMNASLQFIICGTGPYKEELMRLAEEQTLTNLKFLPLQEYHVFNEFLNMADIHLVLQKANASDLVMPSKLTTILSVGGLALVTANIGTTLRDIIDNYEMGVAIDPEDEDLLANKIISISKCNSDSLRQNARKYAVKYLNKDNILARMISDIN